MDTQTKKILIGSAVFIGGLIAYSKTENKITYPGEIGSRTLSGLVVIGAAIFLYKSIK